MTSPIEQLTHVPEHNKIVETFGWQFAIWGSSLLIIAGLFASSAKKSLVALEWEIAGISALIGLCFIRYEFYRRRNRTVLVKNDDQILVYRKGCLDLMLSANEIRTEKADLVLMLKIGVPLGICGLIFTAIGVDIVMRNMSVNAESLILLTSGIAFFASLISAAWTRFARVHLRVPVKGSRWLAEETVLLTSAQCKELFS